MACPKCKNANTLEEVKQQQGNDEITVCDGLRSHYTSAQKWLFRTYEKSIKSYSCQPIDASTIETGANLVKDARIHIYRRLRNFRTVNGEIIGQHGIEAERLIVGETISLADAVVEILKVDTDSVTVKKLNPLPPN